MNRAVAVLLLLGVGQYLHAQELFPAEWKDEVGVEADATSGEVRKTDSNGWNSGAISENILGEGQDGFLVHEITNTSGYYFIGFSDENVDNGYKTIDYAFYVAGQNLYVRLNGSNKKSLGRVAVGDRIEILREKDQIIFKFNGSKVYTVSSGLTGELFADCSIYHSGRSMGAVWMSTWVKHPIIWINQVGVSYNTSTKEITKTGSIGWNAGASSNAVIPASTDGYLFHQILSGNGGAYFIGLSDEDVNAHYNTIDYAFYVNKNFLYVRKNGKNIKSLGSIPSGSYIEILRVGTAIKFLLNGVSVYAEYGALQGELMADISVYQSNLRIGSVSVSEPAPIIYNILAFDSEFEGYEVMLNDQSKGAISKDKSKMIALSPRSETQKIDLINANNPSTKIYLELNESKEIENVKVESSSYTGDLNASLYLVNKDRNKIILLDVSNGYGNSTYLGLNLNLDKGFILLPNNGSYNQLKVVNVHQMFSGNYITGLIVKNYKNEVVYSTIDVVNDFWDGKIEGKVVEGVYQYEITGFEERIAGQFIISKEAYE